MRKGGGEEERRGGARELFVMYVQRAHGDTAAVGNDFDTQGSSLGEDETHFALESRVE